MTATSGNERRPQRVRCFYRHLMATTAAQLVLGVVALAVPAVRGWLIAAVLLTSLALAAHAADALRPALRQMTDARWRNP